jgi:galactoside O-acetyltransferase
MDNHERMLAGKVYDPSDAGIMVEQSAALELLYDFNASRPSQQTERAELLRQMFAEIGDG